MEGEIGEEKQFAIKNIYSDFFETEMQGVLYFSKENKLEQIDLYTVSSTTKINHEFCEKIVEKITIYYTKKYGKVKKSYEEDNYALYYWETDDWWLRIDCTYTSFHMMIGTF